MTTLAALNQARRATVKSLNVFLRDVGHGMLEISHNALALVGLAVVAALIFAGGRADLRQHVEVAALEWLQLRHEARAEADGNLLPSVAEPEAVGRATALDLQQLPRSQSAVAVWLSRRYKVAPEPIGRLVQEAWNLGQRAGVDPTLILAIMAVESSFNPFAQSPVGAQGLMQVMTRVHDDKYVAFGGNHAAFDPVANLRVGVQVLKECIARAGSVEAGLRHYVGAALLGDDNGYAARVLAEQSFLKRVADGHGVPVNSRPALPAAVPAIRESEAAPTPGAPDAIAAEAERVALLRR